MNAPAAKSRLQLATTIRFGNAREAFLRSLTRDLRSAGFDARVRHVGSRLTWTASLMPFLGAPRNRFAAALRARQLQEEAPFLAAHEDEVLQSFANDRDEIDPDRISVRLELCESRAQHALYRYARLRQTVPNAKRFGRQLNCLIFDAGQRRPLLIGAMGLASSLYRLSCRDRYLHWDGNRLTREQGLRSIMDLAVCVAVPPYNALLGAKFIAALAFSESVRSVFRERYHSELRAILTTSATGLHCPIFNRIMLCKGGLYRRIGATTGFSTVLFSRSTIALAQELAGKGVQTRELPLKGANPMPVLRSALRVCGIDSDSLLRMSQPKGVYFGCLDRSQLRALRQGNTTEPGVELTQEDCTRYWRTLVVKRTSGSDALLKERLRPVLASNNRQ